MGTVSHGCRQKSGSAEFLEFNADDGVGMDWRIGHGSFSFVALPLRIDH